MLNLYFSHVEFCTIPLLNIVVDWHGTAAAAPMMPQSYFVVPALADVGGFDFMQLPNSLFE